MTSIPWVEKYRPDVFPDIIMDKYNRQFFENLIETSQTPNMLFYGPPGTGKTTTIINFIRLFQERNEGHYDKSMIMHLNASDDRGVEVIRNQIQQFVSTKPFFSNGVKFVILDEADYMTKNAQLALHKLIQTSCHHSTKVCICLICNYISKIESYLQNEFIHIRFNTLDNVNILQFLTNILVKENIEYKPCNLQRIVGYFKNDVRSMINFIQIRKNEQIRTKLLNETVFNKIEKQFENKTSYESFSSFIRNLSMTYEMDELSLLSSFFSFITLEKTDSYTDDYHMRMSKIVEIFIENINIVEPRILERFVHKNMISLY